MNIEVVLFAEESITPVPDSECLYVETLPLLFYSFSVVVPMHFTAAAKAFKHKIM